MFIFFFLQAILQNVKVSSYTLPICIRKCHFSSLTITQSKEPVTCTQHCEEMSLLHAGVIQYLGTQYHVCFGTHYEEHKTKNKKNKSKSQTVSVDKLNVDDKEMYFVCECTGGETNVAEVTIYRKQ